MYLVNYNQFMVECLQPRTLRQNPPSAQINRHFPDSRDGVLAMSFYSLLLCSQWEKLVVLQRSVEGMLRNFYLNVSSFLIQCTGNTLNH